MAARGEKLFVSRLAEIQSLQMLLKPRIHRSHALVEPGLLHPAAVFGVFEEGLLRGHAE